MSRTPFNAAAIRTARALAKTAPPDEVDPEIKALVNDLIGRVADKWTMIVLEVLAEHGELRFTQVSRHIPGISQKMLTQTLRQMERDGMITRTVHPVVPPRVEYRLTDMGESLGAAFCGVWIWAEENIVRIQQTRELSRSETFISGIRSDSSAISPHKATNDWLGKRDAPMASPANVRRRPKLTAEI